MAQRNSGPAEIDILRVTHGRFDACILGTTPIILNRMSDKAMREHRMSEKARAKR